MFGLKKKESVKVIAALIDDEGKSPAQPDPVTVFGTPEWFAAISGKDYLKLVDHLIAKTEKIMSVQIYAEAEDQDKMKKNLLSLLELSKKLSGNSRAVRLEYQYLYSRSDPLVRGGSLHSAIFQFIQPHLAGLTTYGGNWLIPHDDAVDGLARIEEYARMFLSEKTQENKADIFEGLEIEGKAPTDLEHNTSYPIVNERVNRLNAFLSGIDRSSLLAEDSYFVEQIVNSHIPEIVEFAKRMKSLAGQEREEASNNFTVQLDAIQEKLETIMSTTSKRLLEEVKSQTAFLVTSLESLKSPQAIEMRKEDPSEITRPTVDHLFMEVKR